MRTQIYLNYYFINIRVYLIPLFTSTYDSHLIGLLERCK